MRSIFEGQTAASQVTNLRLSVALQGKPGIENLPEVNNLIFADMLRVFLDSAEELGVGVDVEKYTRIIATLKGNAVGAALPPPNTATAAPPNTDAVGAGLASGGDGVVPPAVYMPLIDVLRAQQLQP